MSRAQVRAEMLQPSDNSSTFSQERVVGLLFGLLCVLGLTHQLHRISMAYFEFNTSAQLNLSKPAFELSPELAVCFDYDDIIDDAAQQQLSPTTSSLTLQEIFNLSPNVTDVFHGCNIRFPNTYYVQRFLGIDCLAYFAVTRFYTAHTVCYNFGVREKGEYEFATAASAIEKPAMAFEIDLSLKHFSRVNKVRPIVHDGFGLPVVSLFFASFYGRYFNLSHVTTRNYFHLAGSMISNTLLKRPYKTHCVEYPDLEGKATYFKRCLTNKTLRYFKKFPFSEIIGETENLYNLSHAHISNQDLENLRFVRKLGELEEECNSLCRDDDCFMSYTITQLLATGANVHENRIRFRVDLPKNPSFVLEHRPLIRFWEYLVYIMSCLGTWLGISALQLNPLRVYKRLHPMSHRTCSGRRHVMLFEYLRRQSQQDVFLRQLLMRVEALENSHKRSLFYQFGIH